MFLYVYRRTTNDNDDDDDDVQVENLKCYTSFPDVCVFSAVLQLQLYIQLYSLFIEH